MVQTWTSVENVAPCVLDTPRVRTLAVATRVSATPGTQVTARTVSVSCIRRIIRVVKQPCVDDNVPVLLAIANKQYLVLSFFSRPLLSSRRHLSCDDCLEDKSQIPLR